jgi:hypothetical protein
MRAAVLPETVRAHAITSRVSKDDMGIGYFCKATQKLCLVLEIKLKKIGAVVVCFEIFIHD